MPYTEEYDDYYYEEEVLTVGSFILIFIILMIPLVNLVMLIAWSFSSNINLNKRNFARSILLMTLFSIILIIVLGIFLGPVVVEYLNELMSQFIPTF